MHSATPSEEKDKISITLSTDEAQKYRKNLQAFQNNFQTMQNNFQSSQNSTYYIVSTKFIRQWRDFCLSNELKRYKPNTMNSDIIQKVKADGIESYTLKKNLVQKEQFQIIDQSVYQLFEPFNQNLQVNNRRRAIIVGRQKQVPIYPSVFKYILTTYQILKAIDFNRKGAQSFTLKEVHISEQNTLKDLIQQISEIQELSKGWEFRIWQSQKGLNAQKLHKLIRQELKPCSLASYKVSGVGKRLDDQSAKICDVIYKQESEHDRFFVVQAKKQSQRFVFLKDDEGRCQNCNKFEKLEVICGCNKVKYCSEECLQKDKHYHMRRCAFAEQMELNKKIQMIITKDSRMGIVGLNNLGNTCFMNSCLQCLSHTKPLTDYFLNMYFEAEINKVNPIGTKGKLAKNYAKFVKAMWCDSEQTFSPYSVKNAVSDINPMFSGYAQHDSQQFFSFLVDGLHEDLNRIQKKPYVESVQQGHKSDVQLSKQSWIAHLKRNQSIIVDTMSGQYRSIVTCPDCKHQSTTFDPFITITLPIPQSIESSTDFFFIRANMQTKTQRAWFKYTKGDAQEWNYKAIKAVGGDPNRCCLYVVTINQNIYRVGKQSMTQIVHKVENQHKNLFLIEFTKQQAAIPQDKVIQLTSRISKESYHDAQNVFFKFPILFDRTKQVTGLMIFKKILKILYGEAYDESKNRKTFGWGGKSYEDYQAEKLNERPFKIFLRVGKKLQRSYSRTQIKFEKDIEIGDNSNLIDIIQKGQLKPDDYQIDARFERRGGKDFSFEKLKDFETVGKQPKLQKSSNQEIGIQKCFSSFSQPQVLQAGNQWYCPQCKDHKLAMKKLSIYRAPKVLILHLKRFKQKGTFKKQKNQTVINFPQLLDMTPYLINPDSMNSYKSEIAKQNIDVYIPPKFTSLQKEIQTKSKPLYQLYAISNHFGSLSGGHYTAYAKSREQNCWYNYNDSSVSKCDEKKIINEGNYLLFYQRKQ